MTKYLNLLEKILIEIEKSECNTNRFFRPRDSRTPYAGVGSRNTPEITKKIMTLISRILEICGCLFRSGGADGADHAFEQGICIEENKEIYIIKKGYKGSISPFFNILPEAYEIAERFHPVWDRLKPYTKSLLARTSHVIFGENLNKPVKFIIAWTQNGRIVGGTGQALRIGIAHNIKIFNLGIEKEIIELMRFIKKLVKSIYKI